MHAALSSFEYLVQARNGLPEVLRTGILSLEEALLGLQQELPEQLSTNPFSEPHALRRFGLASTSLKVDMPFAQQASAEIHERTLFSDSLELRSLLSEGIPRGRQHVSLPRAIRARQIHPRVASVVAYCSRTARR